MSKSNKQCANRLIAFDQAFKVFTEHQSVTLIPGILRIHYTENHGFSLGLFDQAFIPALLVSALVLAGVWLLRARLAQSSPLRFPLLLICSGAIGNLIDRIFLGYVRDMIDVLFIRFYVFNFADIYVTVGALICAIMLLKPERKVRG